MVEISLECAIIGQAGTFDVTIDDGKKVSVLKNAIKEQSDGKITVPSPDLQLFLAKKADGGWLTEADVKKGVEDTDGLTPLDVAGAPLNLVVLSEKDVWLQATKEHVMAKTTPVHVLVEVPPSDVGSKRPADDELVATEKKLKTMTLTDFINLSVNEEDFQLDSLFTKQPTARPIVETPELHEFWKGFGEFPPYYFVRMEEVVFWEVIKKFLLTIRTDRVVIVGSPGVGESCFLMLIAFYLACIKKMKVLVIRRLNQSELKNAVVFFTAKDRTHD